MSTGENHVFINYFNLFKITVTLIKSTLHIFFLLVSSFLSAQNLVPNPGFENMNYCPFGMANPEAVSSWYNPSKASTDYYNSCSTGDVGVPDNVWGYQNALDGNAYLGLCIYGHFQPDYREYMQVRLTQKLEAGKSYCWSFWTSLQDEVGFATNGIGIGLSHDSLTDTTTIGPLPIPCIGFDNEINTDTENWKEVSGFYTATGGEEYLTLGTFFDDETISYTQVINSGWVSGYGYYYVDKVYFGPCMEPAFPNIFTPNNDGKNDSWGFELPYEGELTILNRWGNPILKKKGFSFSWDGSECSDGVYYFRYTSDQFTKSGAIELIR